MKGMRRNNPDKPARNTEAERARIAADVEAFLANGGSIQECGHGETELINGLPQNLITKANLGRLRNASRT